MNPSAGRLFGSFAVALMLAQAMPREDGVFRREPTGIQSAYLREIGASSHAANLLQLRDGDIVATWFTGEWEGKSGVGIAFARLAKGSQRWSLPRLIDSEAGVSFQNPVLFEAPDGMLWLFHTTQPAGQGQADAKVLVAKSRDRGNSWTPPQVLFDLPGSFTRQPVVVRHDGAWLLPMYVTPSAGITTNAETNYSVIKISKDQGRSWADCPVPASNGYVQPSVVQLSPTRYVAFFRSRFADHIFRSESPDGCRWSQPTPTTLPNNNSSIQATLLHDGKIAISFNNTHGAIADDKPTTGARVPLSVALSSDGGKSWTDLRNIETGRDFATDDPALREPMPETTDREEYSYPSILQANDGSILVAYTWRRKTIKVVRFPESWLEK